MRKGIAVCLVLLLALSQGAVAQQTDDIDPKALEAARALIVATKATANLELMIDAMVPSMIEILKRDKADIPEDVIAKFIPEFRAEMRKGLPQITELYARVYARHFTLQELQDVAKFYESPLGKKLIAETPLILKETLPIAQQWGEKVGQQAAINAIAKLRAQGVKI
jgi:hypothetical protein